MYGGVGVADRYRTYHPWITAEQVSISFRHSDSTVGWQAPLSVVDLVQSNEFAL
jgi:hypothetical protein